jgi:DNA-directed RNA polymerase subunit RPC12/RpoP
MTQPTATCPNCGAKIVFKWSSSVQTVCDYCKSVLVRTDIDLQVLGKAADLPPDISPVQINAEGVYRNKSFVVIGRILYEYDQGGWNEWHLMMNDGGSGWLSDAQEEYGVSFSSKPSAGQALPRESQLQVGRELTWDGTTYTLSVITQAYFRGVEGELPFKFWDKSDMVFADLRSSSRKFATLDYSDADPALYLGEFVEFEDLKLKNLRKFEGWS